MPSSLTLSNSIRVGKGGNLLRWFHITTGVKHLRIPELMASAIGKRSLGPVLFFSLCCSLLLVASFKLIAMRLSCARSKELNSVKAFVFLSSIAVGHVLVTNRWQIGQTGIILTVSWFLAIVTLQLLSTSVLTAGRQ